jgi:hypothetical protein
MAKLSKEKGTEIEPDAWQRFERAVARRLASGAV